MRKEGRDVMVEEDRECMSLEERRAVDSNGFEMQK